MIGQYLSNKNEIDTIHILPKILEVNKALVPKILWIGVLWSKLCLVPKKF